MQPLHACPFHVLQITRYIYYTFCYDIGLVTVDFQVDTPQEVLEVLKASFPHLIQAFCPLYFYRATTLHFLHCRNVKHW